MANMTLLLFIYIDVWIVLGLFAYLRKKKKLIGFQLGMNISIVMGGMVALLSGVLLIQQFPFHFTWVTVISTCTGMAAGACYGILFDYQTFVTGLTNGLVVGVMSPMIGTVIDMPFIFICFIHVLFGLILIILITSIKRS